MTYDPERAPREVDRFSYAPMHDYRTVDVDAWSDQWFSGIASLDPESEEYRNTESVLSGALNLHTAEREIDIKDLSFGMWILSFIGRENPYEADSQHPGERHEHETWDNIYSLARLIGRQIVRVTLNDAERFAAGSVEREFSTTDSLTGLSNRRGFHRRLKEQYCITDDPVRRSPSGRQLPPIRLTHLYADANRFKWINDSLGHHVGDAAIIEAAWRAQAVLRQAEAPIIYRHGGDEFGAVLGGLSDDEIYQITNRIMHLQITKVTGTSYRTAIRAIEEHLQAVKESGQRVRAEVRPAELSNADVTAGERPHFMLYINGKRVTEIRNIVSLSVGIASAYVSNREDVENLRRSSESGMERSKAMLNGIIEEVLTPSPHTT